VATVLTNVQFLPKLLFLIILMWAAELSAGQQMLAHSKVPASMLPIAWRAC
jgi:hypothetical protein